MCLCNDHLGLAFKRLIQELAQPGVRWEGPVRLPIETAVGVLRDALAHEPKKSPLCQVPRRDFDI